MCERISSHASARAGARRMIRYQYAWGFNMRERGCARNASMDASPGGVGAARRPALLHTAVPPQPVTSSTAAADAFSRDGLFIMHDVVRASDLHELRTAARNCFGEVVQALTLGDGECFGAGD